MTAPLAGAGEGTGDLGFPDCAHQLATARCRPPGTDAFEIADAAA
jgi:hypothetical protein